MVYYPLPLYKQGAFARYVTENFELPVTEKLCSTVVSLPIHTEMDEEVQSYIIAGVIEFFEGSAAVGGAN
jgi:dTDP-4-amino-4,6-dideoxygalactose transaminase